MSTDFRTKIDDSTRTAEEFTKLYYESLDKKRHQISRLYLDNATAVWNGNGVNGKDGIQKFIEALPSTEHTITTMDVQPIIDDALSNQTTLMIMVSGMSKIPTKQYQKNFQQTFMITAQGDKWKIVSDCFRVQDGLSTVNNTK